MRTWLFPLLLLAAPALAGPFAERALDEMPEAIGTDARLVVVSEKPGAVHWGVNGWTRPAASLWPAGTAPAGATAVDTPLVGPGPDGRWRATLGPFRQGVGSVEIVLRHTDGSWTSKGGRDAVVRVVAGTDVRRRPVTIGRGPWLGRSGGVDQFEELLEWEQDDCRGVDPADDALPLGDGKDASRDLIAFYSRREGEALFLRADLLDLGLGDEAHALDLVVLIDCAPGGQTWLPDFVRPARTAHGWELALRVRDGDRAELVDASWKAAGGWRGAYVRADLDAIETGLDLDALRRAGWDGQRELGFQVYTLRDGDPRIADAFGERDLGDGALDARVGERALGGTAKYSVILHGNQAVQPLRWLSDLVENHHVKTPAGNPTGYGRALDAHELFRVPVNVHVSGTLAATAEWGARGFNDRVRALLDGRPENGEGALIGGVLAEHIMPYFENARSAQGGEGVNGCSVRLNDELLDRIYGGPRRSVFWIPERVVRGATFADVVQDARGRDTGYRFAVIDQVTHLQRWFGAHDAHSARGRKLNRVNGVSCFVINDDADQWKFANTDGGLWVWTRRDLVRRALDPDQEQLTLVFDDWEAFAGRSFTSFGVGSDNPDNYERTVRWLANHPWVQVVTLEEVASWGWTPVERGYLPDLPVETYDWLRHASQGSYDAWYHGSAQEESFAALRPEVVPGRRTPKPFGEVDRPGGLFHDVWAKVARAPRGRLQDLAGAIYNVSIFETAWHDEDMNDYHAKTPAGEYARPDTTWDRVSGWALAMQARVGDAGYAAAAARWSANPPAAARAWREDVDEDGEEELLLADRRGFYLFEDDGGRLVLAAARDPVSGKADAVVASLLQAPGEETRREREAEHQDRVTRVPGLVDWWATGRGNRYVNAPYRADPLGDGWRLTSDDGLVEKRLTIADGKLRARYRVDPAAGTLYVRTGLAPAPLDLFMGAGLRTWRRADGALAAEAPSANGQAIAGVALLPGPGATLLDGATFGGQGPRGVAFAHQVEVEGRGSFELTIDPWVR